MYRIRKLVKTLHAKHYIEHFRDVERINGYCKHCDNYGRCWACPPFEADWTPILQEYELVSIFATQIFFESAKIPYTQSRPIITPIRHDIECQLRQYEAVTGGRAFAFAGKCLYCTEEDCSRIVGLPCRHPDLVRPSLEAVGFDISKTMSELFDIQVLWSKDGFLPEYYVLVSGLFHNEPLEIEKFE